LDIETRERGENPTMTRPPDAVEPILQEAIRLLESRGLLMQAGLLRDRLARLEAAPTAAARRRRAQDIVLPPVSFARSEPRGGAIRWQRSETDRLAEGRYRRLLAELARFTGDTTAPAA
jgi:hypothetical protein